MQVYKMENESFLIDFKAIAPISSGSKAEQIDAFSFLDACTRLITELAVAT